MKILLKKLNQKDYINWLIAILICIIIISLTFYFYIGRFMLPLKCSNFENVRAVISYKYAMINQSDENIDQNTGDIINYPSEKENETELDNNDDSVLAKGLLFSNEKEYGRTIKSNKIIYSEDSYQKQYFYKKNNKDYVSILVTNSDYDSNEEKWYELENKNFQQKPILDFSNIYNISAFNLKKDTNGYTLKKDKDKIFRDILGISENKDDVLEDCSFVFKRGKLISVHFEYIHSNTLYYVYNINFTYGNQELVIPKLNQNEDNK